MKILVVDDHAENRYLSESILRGREHAVLQAAHGAEALDLARGGGVDLVVSDILMPVMDGFELCRRFKADPALAAIPFVFHTATYTGPHDEEFARRIGAAAFVVKPCEHDTFVAALEEAAVGAGRRGAAAPPPAEEEVLKLYNERLVRKLEQKMIELEAEAAARARADRERSALESRLREAEKLESVGRLAGGVAHDFNNLLAVMIGFGEQALGTLAEGHPGREPLRQVLEAAERARGLVRQLFAFSRREPIALTPVDVGEAVTRFEPTLRRLVGDEVRLAISLPPEPVVVKADLARFEQVLMNLAVNARDAMPDGGDLAITLREAAPGEAASAFAPAAAPTACALLEVRDTGVGMDKETLGRIFEPFFTTKEGSTGTGLGLSTTYGIVRQHGGGVRVESVPGAGSVFRVFLPLAESEAGAPHPPLPHAGTGVGSVLVVESDPLVRGLAAKILAREGYMVLEAASSEEAARMITERGEGFDLLLVDAGAEGEAPLSMSPGAVKIRMTAADAPESAGGLTLRKPFTAAALVEACRRARARLPPD